MKQSILMFVLFMLSACNFNETVKETGDVVETGAKNLVEGAKQMPAAIGEASRKVEKDIKGD